MATASNASISQSRVLDLHLPPLPQNYYLFVLLSLLVVIPCFWHPHIEAGDLGSHLYNAWLVELIHDGKAPGLYTVWQFDNVLFDLMLFYFAKVVGLFAAEKIAVSLCVLIFFWGTFAFARAATGNTPWVIAPLIAMLTYGYIFHMGFMNYYLSLGFAAIGLALVWPARRNGIIVACLLAPIMLLAHPIGFLWFLGAAAYRLLWMHFLGHYKLVLFVLGLLIIAGARYYVSHHYYVEYRDKPFWGQNGADQFYVFGERYEWFTYATIAFTFVASVIAAVQLRGRLPFWKSRRLILELYLLSFAATSLLPENIQTDPNAGWIGALVSRLTLISAILLLCWLASMPPHSWHLAFSLLCAVVFFTFLHEDTGFLSRMETNTRRITVQLPFGTRTLSTVFAPNDYRTIYLHIPDRACIGHCFLVSNYEPSTKQFRVRVQQGSPVVASSVDDSEDMQSGTYDVEDEDLPLKQIYQCSAADLTKICIRDLHEDEKNGRVGYHPGDNPFFSQNP